MVMSMVMKYLVLGDSGSCIRSGHLIIKFFRLLTITEYHFVSLALHCSSISPLNFTPLSFSPVTYLYPHLLARRKNPLIQSV
jgi:hypothetical protein